jgi:AraC family transcriptional regulator
MGVLKMDDINSVILNNDDISPKILYATYYTPGTDIKTGQSFGKRYCYDYEIEFYTKSDGGEMIIENTTYPINRGNIILRKPGQLVEGIALYSCYFFCFDLAGNTSKDIKSYHFSKPQLYQNYYINTVIDSIPPVLHTVYPEKYEALFDNILKYHINSTEVSELIMKADMIKILYLMYLEAQNKNAYESGMSCFYSLVKKITDFIKSNSHKKIKLEDMAAVVNLSPNHMHKIFRQVTNTTPNEYLINYRMKKAKELLLMEHLPIKEVSQLCGYDNICYFHYVFKQRNGFTPDEFRQKHRYPVSLNQSKT